MGERRLIRHCKHCGDEVNNPQVEECQACGGPLVQQQSLGEFS